MKKEEAYRDKSGCYVAFEYNGHVFVLKRIPMALKGEILSFAFCPISSDTEFAVRFVTVSDATVAVSKIGLKVIYTQEWEVLENKNFNTFCVDKLQWKEWHEYQEVLRHAAPFAAIAVGNRVYKDTYSTALSDGNAWVFAAGGERLVGFSSRLTHKIDQLLFAVRQYPDMKLFDTEEERTEWSLKYLEEYAAKPEPTPVAEEQEVVPIGSIIDPMDESWDVVDNNGMPHGVDAARKFLTLVTASSDAQPIIETDGIKTMKPGVTPQPSRSRIGKIAARSYEYVYDGPQQMGTTFVSRYRIDDEVWVRTPSGIISKMVITAVYVAQNVGTKKVFYHYDLNDGKLVVSAKAEAELYDTLFDLVSAMTSISVEELIAAAKEVV